MAAVRFLGTAPGRLDRVVGPTPATSRLGVCSTLPVGRVRPYFVVRSVPSPGGAERKGARAGRRTPRAAMGGDLFALDFDGVLCDSCGESSLSAVKVSLLRLPCCVPDTRQMSNCAWFGVLWQAAKVRWPWVFEKVDSAMEEWIVEQMYTVSPHRYQLADPSISEFRAPFHSTLAFFFSNECIN
jgi:hypothetical protein